MEGTREVVKAKNLAENNQIAHLKSVRLSPLEKSPSFPRIGASNPFRITQNNSQGVIFS